MAGKRAYTDGPIGHARELRDSEDVYLARFGHRMTWTRGHGVRWLKGAPGYKGLCGLCGGVVRLAWVGRGVSYNGYEGAMAKRSAPGPRRCTRGR
jgi:hypothetical protein